MAQNARCPPPGPLADGEAPAPLARRRRNDANGIGAFLDQAVRGGAEAVLADALAAFDAGPSSLVIFDWNAGAPVIR